MNQEIKHTTETAIEVVESELVSEAPTVGLDVTERAQIDMAITTARKYPRSLKTFRDQAMSMATIDEPTAASCFYVLPRGGKNIQGPSIRLAEIVGLSWGNLRYGARVIGEDDSRRNIIAEAFCHDLQSNNHCTIRVMRRITDKHGKRYNDDMIAMTGNSACSIALRNAIFKIVPMTYVNSIYEQAKKLAVGDASSLSDRRMKMLEYFSKFGVTKERLLARIGKPSIDDIDLNDLEMLVGLSTAIKDGETDIDTAFPREEKNGEKPATLAEKVKSKAAEVNKTIGEVQNVFPGAKATSLKEG